MASDMNVALDCGIGCPISLTKGFCYFWPVKIKKTASWRFIFSNNRFSEKHNPKLKTPTANTPLHQKASSPFYAVQTYQLPNIPLF